MAHPLMVERCSTCGSPCIRYNDLSSPAAFFLSLAHPHHLRVERGSTFLCQPCSLLLLMIIHFSIALPTLLYFPSALCFDWLILHQQQVSLASLTLTISGWSEAQPSSVSQACIQSLEDISVKAAFEWHTLAGRALKTSKSSSKWPCLEVGLKWLIPRSISVRN